MSEQDAHAVHAAGEAAAQARQDHYLANISGQGNPAGDPAGAPSDEMPSAPPPPDKATT